MSLRFNMLSRLLITLSSIRICINLSYLLTIYTELIYTELLFHVGTSKRNFSQSVSSVAQSCPTLCDPMNRSMSGLPVHHQLPEFTQTHVH